MKLNELIKQENLDEFTGERLIQWHPSLHTVEDYKVIQSGGTLTYLKPRLMISLQSMDPHYNNKLWGELVLKVIEGKDVYHFALQTNRMGDYLRVSAHGADTHRGYTFKPGTHKNHIKKLVENRLREEGLEHVSVLICT